MLNDPKREAKVIPPKKVPIAETRPLQNVCNWTGPLNAAATPYGYVRTEVVSTLLLLDPLHQKLSTLLLSPHAVTHLDGVVRKSSRGIARMPPLGMHVYPCVVMNISGKSKIIDGILNKQDIAVHEIPPRCFWTCEQLDHVLESICIRRRELEHVWHKGLEAIVFRTGWHKYIPAGDSLSDKHYVPWHPFLLHPYLDPEALDFLHQEQIKLVGTDSYSLEFPYHRQTLLIDDSALSHLDQKIKAHVRAQCEKHGSSPDIHDWSRQTPPVYLLENVHVPYPMFIKKNHCYGRLLVSTYPSLFADEEQEQSHAVPELATVYFLKDKEVTSHE